MTKTYDVLIRATIVLNDGDRKPEDILFDPNEVLERVKKSGRVYSIESEELIDDAQGGE